MIGDGSLLKLHVNETSTSIKTNVHLITCSGECGELNDVSRCLVILMATQPEKREEIISLLKTALVESK